MATAAVVTNKRYNVIYCTFHRAETVSENVRQKELEFCSGWNNLEQGTKMEKEMARRTAKCPLLFALPESLAN